MSSVEVLFCRENLVFKGKEAWGQLVKLSEPRLRLQEVKCIIACSECATMFIARVNGELVSTDTAEELVAAVLKRLE